MADTRPARSVPNLPESLLARYEVGEALGAGAMGVVYRAVHRALDRPVALKVIRGELLDAEGKGRFLQEAKLAAKIVDPHVVLVFDSGTEGGVPFIAFELIEGPTLRTVMDHEALEPAVAVTYVAHVATGLARAHEVGIIHRDVKPENVLITPQGLAKIADFGISRPAATDQPNLTATGTILGSPLYMSPEQAGNRVLTPATDQYSLGVMLYEMLAGRPPFEGSTAEILAQHLRDPIVLPPALRARVHLGIVEVLEKMLRKEPTERYPTCAEVAAALERSLSRWQGRRVNTIPTPRPRSVPALEAPRGTRASGVRSGRPARESARHRADAATSGGNTAVDAPIEDDRSDTSVLEVRQPLPAAVKVALVAIAIFAMSMIAYTVGRHGSGPSSPWPRGTIVGNTKTRVYHIAGVTEHPLPSRLNTKVFTSEESAKQAGYRRAGDSERER
jgi:serine/threonine protein kinase